MTIEIIHLAKTFISDGTSKGILRDISLSIPRGTIYALTGANGAGKTTLLKILATLVLPSAGTARISGYDLCTRPHEARASLGLVADTERSFYQVITLRDNLKFYGRLFGMRTKLLDDRVRELAAVFGISPWLDTSVSHCSSGIRQRSAIVRALLPDPPVLLVDELSRSLDADSRENVSRCLRRLADEEKKTCLIVTHDAGWAGMYADATGCLADGVIRPLEESRSAATGNLPASAGGGMQRMSREAAVLKKPPPSAGGASLNLLRAFFLRDIAIEKRYRFNILIKSSSILFQLAIFYYIALLLGAAYFPFVFVGLLFSRFFQFLMGASTENIRQEQYWGTAEVIFLSPRRPHSVFLAIASGKALLFVFEMAVYAVLGILVFGVHLQFSPLFIAALAVDIVIFAGLGIAAGSFIMDFKRGDPVNWLVAGSFELLSGVYFPVKLLPVPLQALAGVLPTTIALDAWRDIFLSGSGITGESMLIQGAWAAGAVLLAAVSFRRSFRRVRIRGDLGSY